MSNSVESGRKIAVGLAKETVRGTAATAAYWVPQTSINFQNKNKQIQDTSVFGTLDKVSNTDVVEEWSEGKISGLVRDRSFGLLLLGIFGSSASVVKGGESIVYNTTFSQNQSNTPQSLTVTRFDTNSDLQYARGMEKSLDITSEIGKYVEFETDLYASKGTTNSDTVSYTAENRFKTKYATAKMASTVGGLSGATAIPMKSLKLSYKRNINPDYIFASNDPDEFYNTEFDVTGSFTLLYADNTYENLYYNNTIQALQLQLQNTDVTIGSSSNPTLLLQFPQLTLSTWDIDQAPDKMVMQTIGFQGALNLSAGYQATAVLTNLVTGY